MSKIRISNSGINRFNGCAASYKYHYIDKLRSPVKSSALFFGSAVDAGCNHILENFNKGNLPILEEAIKIFYDNWEQASDQSSKDKDAKIDLPLNPYIKYFKNDYDSDLLDNDDKVELSRYYTMSDMTFDSYNEWRFGIESLMKTSKNYLDIPESDRVSYNFGSWLSLRKKGPLMLTAYYNEIRPKFKRILTLQRQIEVVDDNDNTVNGIAEFVAELVENDKICLVDNKTASSPYEKDSVKNSQQLALYKQILNIQASTEGADWTGPKIDLAAYAVMSKKIARVKTCESCGYESTGSHKSCNNIVDDKRCGGEWKTTFIGTTQFIVDEIPDEFGESVLTNASEIITCISKGSFPKNFDRCHDVFGGRCEFFLHCRGKNGDPTLISLKEDDKDVKKK